MLLPQLAELDSFSISGEQVDDINSVIEFVDQIILGNDDSTPEDEDDDSAKHFLVIKTIDLYYRQSVDHLPEVFHFLIPAQKIPAFSDCLIPAAATDIPLPPPKASFFF